MSAASDEPDDALITHELLTPPFCRWLLVSQQRRSGTICFIHAHRVFGRKSQRESILNCTPAAFSAAGYERSAGNLKPPLIFRRRCQ